MKKHRIVLLSIITAITFSSCAMRHDSCGAYNRGGGTRGELIVHPGFSEHP